VLRQMPPSAPLVVVAGGGPAAIETLLAVRDLAGEQVRLELIAPEQDLVVRAYEVMAAFHEGHEHRYPLARIAGDLDVALVRDALAGVDPRTRMITLRSGAERAYDVLVVAVGARHIDTVKGAIAFRGARDATKLRALLLESHSGHHRSVAFVVPGGRTWPLPVYELALQTSAWLAERDVTGVPLALVSPEPGPLVAFGSRASAEVAGLLDAHGVRFISAHAVRHADERLLLADGRELKVEIAIALARLQGPAIPGLASDEEGFVEADALGRVRGAERVFAAGDATAFPLKQGGLATQQADAIAELVAAEIGLPVQPAPFRPTLRAVLFAGRERRYLEAELGERLEQTSTVSLHPLWPESTKVVGRRLSPYLERLDQSGTAAAADPGAPA
jgi:sulfide:quinone oxidoreductase